MTVPAVAQPTRPDPPAARPTPFAVPLFRHGFRPFFLLCGLWAVAARAHCVRMRSRIPLQPLPGRGIQRLRRFGLNASRSSMVSIPSPTATTSSTTPNRTQLPSSRPIARLGVAIGALPLPPRASQVRCTPVIVPSRSVTAASSAGHVSTGALSSARWYQRGRKRSAGGRPDT